MRRILRDHFDRVYYNRTSGALHLEALDVGVAAVKKTRKPDFKETDALVPNWLAGTERKRSVSSGVQIPSSAPIHQYR